MSNYSSSVGRAIAVTPSDANNLVNSVRGLYLGVAGNVVAIMSDDAANTSVTFTGLAAGVFHPLKVKRVLATGTTATGIVAVW